MSEVKLLEDNNNSNDVVEVEQQGCLLMDMNRYQWTVLLAAWVGWGMDIFDGMLFTYVAPIAIPSLLGIADRTSKEAVSATINYTGILTSLLLIGWSIGGILFGYVADRFGRLKTLQITIGLFSIGTALCAAVPNIGFLILCRILVSLGIGGEWTAGANLVAESVPDSRRVEAGAILYTAAPFGMFVASFVTYVVESALTSTGNSDLSWRIVMLFGLLPAAVA